MDTLLIRQYFSNDQSQVYALHLILDELQKRAKDKGFKVLCLDTTNVQSTAQKFYLKNGYCEVRRAAMNDSKQPSIELIFYEKNLESK